MSTYKGMHSPAHPGDVLKEGYIKPLKLTQAEVADLLGVSRKTVSGLVNGHAPVTAEMAMRIALVFDSDPGFWLRIQAGWDAWAIHLREKEIRREVTPYSQYAAA